MTTNLPDSLDLLHGCSYVSPSLVLVRNAATNDDSNKTFFKMSSLDISIVSWLVLSFMRGNISIMMTTMTVMKINNDDDDDGEEEEENVDDKSHSNHHDDGGDCGSCGDDENSRHIIAFTHDAK